MLQPKSVKLVIQSLVIVLEKFVIWFLNVPHLNMPQENWLKLKME